MVHNQLYIDILRDILSRSDIRIEFTNMQDVDPADLIECVSYRALCRIKAILEDDHLTDPECFKQIEEIVCTFEQLGSGCGPRHDF